MRDHDDEDLDVNETEPSDDGRTGDEQAAINEENDPPA